MKKVLLTTSAAVILAGAIGAGAYASSTVKNNNSTIEFYNDKKWTGEYVEFFEALYKDFKMEFENEYKIKSERVNRTIEEDYKENKTMFDVYEFENTSDETIVVYKNLARYTRQGGAIFGAVKKFGYERQNYGLAEREMIVLKPGEKGYISESYNLDPNENFLNKKRNEEGPKTKLEVSYETLEKSKIKIEDMFVKDFSLEKQALKRDENGKAILESTLATLRVDLSNNSNTEVNYISISLKLLNEDGTVKHYVQETVNLFNPLKINENKTVGSIFLKVPEEMLKGDVQISVQGYDISNSNNGETKSH